MRLQQLHERLLSWATAAPRDQDLLRAKKDYFARFGEPHEEDRSYEIRLNAMLDHYLYDFRAAEGAATTLERFIEAEGPALSPEELAAYSALAQNVHGLFEVRKIKTGSVRLRDVFSGRDVDVTERRHVVGLQKDDLIEARLLPYEGALVFSGAFLYHPREARKTVLAEVKRLRKATPKGSPVDASGFLARLSRMAMKLERYRNVRLESIYDFSPEARAHTPRPAPAGEGGGESGQQGSSG
jgi:hypothetical protein